MKIRYDEITNFVEYENETDTEVKTEQYYFDPLDFTTPPPDRIVPDVYTQSGEGLCTLPDESTVEPIIQPQQTPEPTIEVKPYKIDTLSKANISIPYAMITSNSKDTIYYVDDNNIYEMDIAGNKKSIVSNKDFMIDDDTKTLDDFKIAQIFYDDNYQLLVLGSYNTVNSANKINNSYLYSVSDSEINLLTDNFTEIDLSIGSTISKGSQEYIYSVFEDGIIFTNNGMRYADTFEQQNAFSLKVLNGKELSSIVKQSDTGSYYCVSIKNNGAYFEEYKDRQIITSWGVENGCSIALTDNTLIVACSDNTIQTLNYNGKILNTINANDYNILDTNNVKFNKIAPIMYSLNNNIIFYDTAAKAFRIISENN